jgi:U3 small nucleolar RNA-associated protein 12
MWHSPSHTATVTHISASPASHQASTSAAQPRNFAVAYQDGSIKLWSYATPASSATAYGADLSGRGADEIVTFNGHKKAVTCMTWSEDGTRLLSGGSEGEIISWDAVGEVGMYRLKGHRGPVTSLHLLPHPTLSSHPGFLLSTSKDTFLKLWDLQTQHCIQTLVVGRAEVLCSDVLHDDDATTEDEQVNGGYHIVTGSGDGELRTFRLEKQALQTGVQEDKNGNVSRREMWTSLKFPHPIAPAGCSCCHWSPLLGLFLYHPEQTVLPTRSRRWNFTLARPSSSI